MDPLTLYNQIANVRVGLTANASVTANSLQLSGNLKASTVTSLALQVNGSSLASSLTASVVVTGGLLISSTLTASSLSGNAFHVLGGALIARDLYIGGLLNNRAIAPSTATYYHSSVVNMSAAVGNLGFTYSSNAPWTLFKTAGVDAAALMQPSGLFVAPTKLLVTITWAGYAGAATSVFCLPTISTYVMNAAQMFNVTYSPSQISLSSANVFSMSFTLPMAMGDTFALATSVSTTVQSACLTMTAQPLGVP